MNTVAWVSIHKTAYELHRIIAFVVVPYPKVIMLFKVNLLYLTCTKLKNNSTIGLYHPQDGVTNPEYKLLCFIQLTIFCKEKKALAFNWDSCYNLVLCLQLILFHYLRKFCEYCAKGGINKIAYELLRIIILAWMPYPKGIMILKVNRLFLTHTNLNK
jgi:hypothetical protein